MELAEPYAPSELELLLSAVRQYNPQADTELIKRAYEYAARRHGGQMRVSGEPFVTHPLNVALIIARLRLDVPSIVTSLLHDVVEDTATSLEEIERLFGGEVAQLVDGVTKVSKISFQSKAEKQAENFRKMIIAMARDIRVVLVKLADRLHNMRTLGALAPERRVEIARETHEIYAPLAHRLGIYWLKSELEEAAFRYLNPEGFAAIENLVARTKTAREEYVQAVIGVIKQRLNEAGIKADVTGRLKDFYSIYHKMEEEELPFDQIHDLVAFRIIVDSLRECYAALGVVHASWKPVPGRFKDYVALPKPNNYQSLHTTVIGPRGQKMEVQIRSRDMHRVAEEGIAAHWSYKEGKIEGLRESQRFAWLRRILEWQQQLNDPHEFLSNLKEDLFAEEVFVFSPKGEVFDFPQGATAIDFAYRIHSEVGNHLAGVRVNGRIAPLRYRLRSGDTVEVLTSERQKPSKDWLAHVVTARAKSRIRSWLRAQQAERSRELGTALIEQELGPLGLSLSQLERAGRLDAAAKELSYKNAQALVAAVGYGLITTAQVLAKLLTAEELKRWRSDKAQSTAASQPDGQPLRESRRPAAEKPSAGGVLVSGLSDVLVRFAGCCNALPGEPICGFITRGRGVTVHLIDCPVVPRNDPQRRVSVVWQSGVDSPRSIRLEVTSVDRPGLLAAMSKAIASAGVNISSAQVRTSEGVSRAHCRFEVSVGNARQLNAVMRSLAEIEGVLKVVRLDQHNGARPS
jgi:guanosine-3',5'-bis(diphosphate) 3'-pyrophosphohydrolase